MTSAEVEAIWRIEAARVIATVARMTRDVSLAEDLAQDAFVTALERWPHDGVPDDPPPPCLDSRIVAGRCHHTPNT